MDDLYRQIFSRNLGFLTEAEQEKLSNATVGIMGLGSVGGLLTERLVRLGIGRLKLGETVPFEIGSLNSEFGSSMRTVGKNKAQILLEELKDINPNVRIDCTLVPLAEDGDAVSFARKCDIVINAMQLGSFKESIMLQRAARRNGAYYAMASAIGFGALAVVFEPAGLTLEEYNGFASNVPLDSDFSIPFDKLCPVLPSYLNESLKAQRARQAIALGEIPESSNSIGVGLAAILATHEVMNLLLRKREPVIAPNYTYVDLLDLKIMVGNIFA
ncbi:MAG: ThiF family adenylyltransferase [Dehalococcoidia bacterium]|nr:ThiF family adenylyltransferase [Dehalococcoidia bacterium]